MHTTLEQRSCRSCSPWCCPPSCAEEIPVPPAAKRRKVMAHPVEPSSKMPLWSETHRANQDTGNRITTISPDVEMMEAPLLQRNGSDIVKNMPFENRTVRAVLDECKQRGIPITRHTTAEVLRHVSDYWN